MEDRDEFTVRTRKLGELRDRSRAYPQGFKRSSTAASLHARFADWSKEQLAEETTNTVVAGRVVLRRVMGKASFITLRDSSGEIQCYLRQDGIGDDPYSEFVELSDRGDIVGITGNLMRTNKGELTVEATEFHLLAKALQPFPEKFHGLEDAETRYRRRYVDLIANESSREVFKTRSEIIKSVRQFFDEREFMEVETPMMHSIPGGAVARPFITHHNALDLSLYLRVAPELYLKRLVVGGFERVYEINRNFRNEGLSTKHNPEFTMLEFYQAYENYEGLIDLTIELMKWLTTVVNGCPQVEYGDNILDFGVEPVRVTMVDAVADALSLGSTQDRFDEERLRTIAKDRSLDISTDLGWGGVVNELFETFVEPNLIQPTFVTQYPIEVSPLARRNDSNPLLADRFEYFVAGREIANGFSELNDPDDQEERFRWQVDRLNRGDQEAMHFDADYITALQYGMPPTAGEGIGIDRIAMLLSNSNTIRDVLLFPLLKPIVS